MTEEEDRRKVRQGYARIAQKQGSCCDRGMSYEASKKMGYSEEDLEAVPEGANMNLGCGNPVALASLKEGETVIDLGSGGGLSSSVHNYAHVSQTQCADWRIGNDSLSTSRTVNGSMDDVRIYNRALSAQEIKQLYSAGR